MPQSISTVPRYAKPQSLYVRLLMILSFILVTWPLADVIYVSTGNITDNSIPSDAIIVLGCPSYENNVLTATFSACIQARAHHAATLYNRGLSQHIIPTGGLTGPPPTEAAAMSTILLSDGVPSAAIFPEDQAHNTIQNIGYSKAIMQAHDWRTAILVTEPNHIKRASLIASDAGLTFTVSPVTESPGWNTPDARTANLLSDARTLMTYQLRRLLLQ